MPKASIVTKILVLCKKAGGHVHMRVFMNGALLGTLTVRKEELGLLIEHWPTAGFGWTGRDLGQERMSDE